MAILRLFRRAGSCAIAGPPQGSGGWLSQRAYGLMLAAVTDVLHPQSG